MNLLDLYLSPAPARYRGAERRSTFAAVLGDARGATGRDEEGIVARPKHAGSWVGAMGYLAFVDQVGRAVKRTDLPPARRARLSIGGNQEKPFRATFVQYTDVSDDRISALYALRCALMHAFSLVNLHAQQRLCHRFVLDTGRRAMVRLPAVPWDKSFAPKRGQRPTHSATCVDLRLLGDTVEEAARRVIAAHADGKLVMLPSTEAEFLRRYTFRITGE